MVGRIPVRFCRPQPQLWLLTRPTSPILSLLKIGVIKATYHSWGEPANAVTFHDAESPSASASEANDMADLVMSGGGAWNGKNRWTQSTSFNPLVFHKLLWNITIFNR